MREVEKYDKIRGNFGNTDENEKAPTAYNWKENKAENKAMKTR